MTIDEIKKLSEETPYTVAEIASSVQSSKRFDLPLNLQFFAESDSGDQGEGDNGADQKGGQSDDKDDKKGDKDTKTFTQAELDDIVEQRLKRAERDKQKAIDEAKKLAKMNADEKREYEFEKLQRENKELKAAQNRYSLGKEATKILAETGIIATDDILDFVVKEDAETTNTAVKAFSDLVDKISDDRMKEKLKGTSPKRQQGTPGALTKSEIMKEPDNNKRQRLIRENYHLFQ